MEKYVVPTVKEDWELFFQSPTQSKSSKKGLFTKTLNQFNQWLNKWDAQEETLVSSKNEQQASINQNLSEQIRVPEKVIHEILEELKIFELNKGYLDKELDLPKLARLIGTNHSYLSRVVNHVKGKSFKKYLNDMRIEYAYVDLQINPRKRLYTVEAIAFDNGFRSAESFSKKFKTRYGCYPSEFLKKLKNVQ